MSEIHSLILGMGRKAQEASKSLAVASSLQKRDALIFAADSIKESTVNIIEQNNSN